MAEEGSSSGFAGVLKKKYAGVPVYVYALIMVLALAIYLKTRKKTAATTTEDTSAATTASTNANVTPQAGTMPWTSDVFVNSKGNSDTATPQTVMISEATSLEDFVAKMNNSYQGLGLTSEAFRQMNPTLNVIRANSHGYLSGTNPERGSTDPSKLVVNVGPSPNSTATVRIR